MDELHTLAMDVARRIVESPDGDEENVEIARMLLEAQSNVPAPQSQPKGATTGG